jgi:uncharacterized protein YegL
MPEETNGRRLPVYLVIDTSGSMSGAPIEAVRQGMRALIADLRGDPMALEMACLSVITFASDARQVCPLTDLASFQEPTLDAMGSTAFGAALRVLGSCVDKEVKKSTATQKGDWKPLVFLMTDGKPTDSWESAANDLKSRRLGTVVALAAGDGADQSLLKNVAEVVMKTDDVAPETLKQFFKWVSSSIKANSLSVASGGAPAIPPPSSSTFVVVP